MRAVGSNLITFLICVTFLFATSSCSKSKYDVIPDVYVDFTISFSDPQFWNISTAGTSAIVTSTNIAGQVSVGYDDNGVIIYNTASGYYAFDRTCPNCYKNGGLSIAVEIGDLDIYAVCPECKTKYVLPSSGTPTSEGPGEYILKNYHTVESAYGVRVWNR
jgi:hypothetical protein